MKPHLICCVLILVLLPSRPDAARIYKPREDLLNLLGADEVAEERLYMELCQQSSDTGNCMLAIDTVDIHEWTQCSASEPEDVGWWKAQMETPSYITRVVISTMSDLPSVSMISGLLDFSIIANDFACYRHKSDVRFVSKSFPCDALTDQLVIQSHQDRSVLSLCEVMPYGIPIRFQGMDVGEMEVIVSHCDQSSILEGKDCNYALDRNFETNPSPANGKLCAENGDELNAFWVAYFPLPTLVKYVKIYQHTEKNRRLGNFLIKVNEVVCNRYKSNEDFESHVFPCQRFGSNLRINVFQYSIDHGSAFSICQVQIFGHMMTIQSDAEIRHIGCFNDNPEKPDLDLMIGYTWMSKAKCFRLCKRANKKFFGLQNGQVCMCGDKYGRYGEVGEDGYGNSTEASGPCSSPCKDASEENCGGPYENSVYEIIV